MVFIEDDDVRKPNDVAPKSHLAAFRRELRLRSRWSASAIKWSSGATGSTRVSCTEALQTLPLSSPPPRCTSCCSECCSGAIDCSVAVPTRSAAPDGCSWGNSSSSRCSCANGYTQPPERSHENGEAAIMGRDQDHNHGSRSGSQSCRDQDHNHVTIRITITGRDHGARGTEARNRTSRGEGGSRHGGSTACAAHMASHAAVQQCSVGKTADSPRAGRRRRAPCS